MKKTLLTTAATVALMFGLNVQALDDPAVAAKANAGAGADAGAAAGKVQFEVMLPKDLTGEPKVLIAGTQQTPRSTTADDRGKSLTFAAPYTKPDAEVKVMVGEKVLCSGDLKSLNKTALGASEASSFTSPSDDYTCKTELGADGKYVLRVTKMKK